MTTGSNQPAPSRDQAAWASARGYAKHLAGGGLPPAMPLSGLVLAPHEQACFGATATYQRFYGTDVTYGQSSFFALGSVPLLVGTAAVSAISNSSRRRKAEQMAAQQWRELQEASLIATNERLMINTAANGWLSFYYNSVQEIYPEPLNWTLTLGWPDTAPLRLRGLAVPYLCVHVARFVLGDRWTGDPSLTPLLAQ